MMRDLGHLDDDAVDRITGQIVAAPRPGVLVTYEEMRRVVAVALFDADAGMRPEARELLAAEWPRLFS